MRDPETPEEWQTAVDMAAGWLAIESARQYGLIIGGPEVKVDACLAMIESGKDHDVFPADDALAQVAVAYNGFATRGKQHGPGCERHRGDPHNLCGACWELEPATEASS